ncbi:MAG: asparagine synthase (glutamine-hydrolyzing) [Terriglobia bacterium]
MCGICGIFNFRNGAPADPERLKRAAGALAHRGPDDEGYYLDGDMGLGNRRLSIIDLPGGHQPLSNEDGSLWITFNGEIYNYGELRSEMVQRGHRFRTATDTEVILHLFEERGTACLKDLRGMFAFALWDAGARRLLLARDRLGVKPLFYRVTSEGIVFASELKAIGALSSQPLETELQSVYDFFVFRYVPAPHTLYRDVRKVLPASFLLVDSNGLQPSDYWDVPKENESPNGAGEMTEEFFARLRESVRLRMIADVPLGVFLSGGIDSSAIVALMAELGVRPLRTFSVGFDEGGYSELSFARKVAERYSAQHQELMVQARDVAQELPRLVALRAEPVAEPTDVALYRISRFAAGSVKVVLAGEGGDELFAGYPKYVAENLARKSPFLPVALARRAARLLPFSQRRLQVALETLSISDENERYASWFASFTRAECKGLFNREFLAEVDVEQPAKVFRECLRKAGHRSPLKRMLYADLKIWLPDNLLLRGDAMTMAASIEERVPFLDHKLVELASRIPERLLLRGFETKAFLRRALQDYLPAEILKRRKVGFTVPIGPWFRGPLKEFVGDLLLSPRSFVRNYFEGPVIERFVDEHLRGTRDRQKQLWALVSFELWERQQGRDQ